MMFADRPVNTGRQKELDLLKGITIILMILIHVFGEVDKESINALHQSITVFGDYPLGATAFMFCMGIGLAYTRHNSSGEFIKRGVLLLTFGQVLNICRYVLPNLAGYFFLGDAELLRNLCLIISVDIMQFAGLAFLTMGILKKLHAGDGAVFAASMLMSILGSVLDGVQTSNYFVNQLLGFFWGTDTESYFPLLNWFIFPAAGLWFGGWYKRLTDKRRFFTRIFAVGIPLYILYCISLRFPEWPVFRFRYGDTVKFTRMYLPDALCCIVFVVTLAGICWLLSHVLPEALMKPAAYLSKNINKFYCVSYCVIITVCYFVEETSPNTVIFGVSTAITLLTAGIIIFYQRFLERSFVAFFSRHALFWTLAVWIASFIIAFIVFNVYDEYPNFLNYYLGL